MSPCLLADVGRKCPQAMEQTLEKDFYLEKQGHTSEVELW
jgi:hypothetical protein